MSDPLATALGRLAPAVDVGASRELFERARDGGERSADAPAPPDRWLLAAACVVLLVAGVARVWALAGRDEPAPGASSTPAVPGDGSEFEVVAVEPVSDVDARSISAAGTYDDLVSIVSRFGPRFAPSAEEVDFDTQVAVVIERGGSSSPDELARFDPAGDTWVVAFRPPGGDIEDVGIGYAYLVAIDRAALTGIDWFVLPSERVGSTVLEELRVAVPGAQDLAPGVQGPSVPAPDELAARLSRFPTANDRDPDDLAALIAAHAQRADRTGALSGVLFHAVPADEWWICWVILESLPQQCGTGIRLAATRRRCTRNGRGDSTRNAAPIPTKWSSSSAASRRW